jgi:recombinational DNA repair protein RecR
MPDFAEPLARLITEFKHLPGVGQKSAQRLAFHMMRSSRDDAERLAQAILANQATSGWPRTTTSAMAKKCWFATTRAIKR